MPNSITLNSFRAAVANANSLDSFARISHDGQSVKASGDSFFGRHFGFHRHLSSSSNKILREELFSSIQNSGLYQQDTLKAIAHDLGISGGKSTIGTKLSLRTVQEILDRADVASPILNDQSFDKPLPQSFTDHMQNCMQAYVDQAKATPPQPVRTSIVGCINDYRRGGMALFINGHNEVPGSMFLDEEQTQALTDTLADFFEADGAHGADAAKIIGKFANQNLCVDLSFSLQHPDAVPIGNILSTDMPIGTYSSFDISRQADGSYKISCKFDTNHTHMMQDAINPKTGAKEVKEIYLKAGSRISYNVNFVLSFDQNNEASIRVEDGSSASGHLKQLSMAEAELHEKYASADPKFRYYLSREQEILDEMKTPEFQALPQAQKMARIRDKIIGLPQMNMLAAIGVDNSIVSALLCHTFTDGLFFNRAFCDQLFSPDQATRNSARAMLQQELNAQAAAGMIPATQLH